MTDSSEKALACYLSGLRGVNLAMIDKTISDARDGGIALERIEKAEMARVECKRLFEKASGKGTHSAEFQRAMDAGQRLFDIAENLNDLLMLRPEVSAKRNLHASQKRARGSHMPLLDAWLDSKLAMEKVSNKRLWDALPEFDDDEASRCVYRDGDDCVIERDGDAVRETSRKGFDNRVTSVRKNLKSPASN